MVRFSIKKVKFLVEIIICLVEKSYILAKYIVIFLATKKVIIIRKRLYF